MPRPPNINRPIPLTTSLPEDLRGWLELQLFSSLEGRVPQGAIQRVIVSLLREYRADIESGKRIPL